MLMVAARTISLFALAVLAACGPSVRGDVQGNAADAGSATADANGGDAAIEFFADGAPKRVTDARPVDVDADPSAPMAWTNVTPAMASPSARDYSAMAFDSAHGVGILFGGATASGDDDETWQWDGSAWTQRTPATSPAPRAFHQMAYDAAHGQIVLFGGLENAETWLWNGTTWTQASPLHSPTARTFETMVYDAAHQRVLMFGGADVDGSFYDETWLWDGSDWTLANPANAPSARYAAALAYDAGAQHVVLAGGQNLAYLADTWQWDGTTWTSLPASGPGQQYPQMVYDAALAKSVLLMTDALGTYEWNGSAWSQAVGAEPSSRAFQTMMYDDSRQQVVVFGGENDGPLLGDTWVYGT